MTCSERNGNRVFGKLGFVNLVNPVHNKLVDYEDTGAMFKVNLRKFRLGSMKMLVTFVP